MTDKFEGVFPDDGTTGKPRGNEPLPGPRDVEEGAVAPVVGETTVSRKNDVKEDVDKVARQEKE